MGEKTNRIDLFIFLPVLFLIFFSLAAIYSASSSFSLSRYNDSTFLFKQHATKVLVAVVIMLIFSRFDYRYLKSFAKWAIWLSIIMLILVLFVGVGKKGASRWIELGFISFQPADIAKFTLVLYMSCLLVRKKEYLHLLYKGYLPVIFYVLVISGLIALQPNFSTALILSGTAFLMISISEVKLKHMAVTLLSMLPIAVVYVLSKDYIINRLTSHAEYSSGGSSSYQLQQAIIGFGNGGFFGLGPGNSLQRELFLPEAYGDFIFSIIGEEYGFFGATIIVLLFLTFMYRGYKTSKEVKDDFGRYLSFGLTTIISAYAFVNMAVATGVGPTTGVPMPFVSYGGTALWINAAAVGILLNISSFRNAPQSEMTVEPEPLLEKAVKLSDI